MTTNIVTKYLLKRFIVLAISMFVMFTIWYLNNDPHKRCTGDFHEHTDTGLALFAGGLLVIIIWLMVLFIEAILYFIKKEKNSLSFILMIILVLGVLALLFI